MGNEMLQYFETLNGQTLIENQDGYLEFAKLDLNQNMVASGIVARNNITPQLKDIPTHLRYSSNQIAILEASFYQINQVSRKKAGGKPFPSTGKRKALTLLIQYPDLPATLPKSNFDSMMVKKNYNGTGSFKDYYLKSSFGQLELEVDVFGWYTAESGYVNYGKSSPNYNYNVGTLIERAVLAADSAGVDFSQYDNDKDGYVDGIIIMHAGIGAEEQSAPSANNHIWSHRYNLAYSVGAVLVDGVYVDSYGIFPEKRYNGGAYSQVGIGVLTHEFGHLLDIPDLYSTQNRGEGAGNFANMAGGPWLNSEKTPCMHDAWTRIALKWAEPTLINVNGIYTIPKSLVDSNFCFRINTSVANEYFLIENRQKKGFDQYLPGRGLAIWHINTNRAKLLSASSGNNVNNDTTSYGVGLKQADGRRDLEKATNRGDGGDLFPGSTTNRNFNSYSTPNSALHYKVGGVRQASNLTISNITQNADSSISFTLGNSPTAAFDAVPSKGCAPLDVKLNNISSFASKYKWQFHDGSQTANLNTDKRFEEAGTYPVTLYVLDSNNNIIDSNRQEIIVESSPVSSFTMTRLDSNQFEFKNTSSGALYGMWKFGSNQSSTANELIYKNTGSADIPYSLIAFSQNQCTDTAYGIMSYWPLGIALNRELGNVEVFPNPFHQNLNLEISLQKRSEVSIQLIDLNGKTLLTESKVLDHGTHKMIIPRNELSPGVYILSITADNFNKILRVSAQ
jgi:M6 family metalloprotease-like protein